MERLILIITNHHRLRLRNTKRGLSSLILQSNLSYSVPVIYIYMKFVLTTREPVFRIHLDPAEFQMKHEAPMKLIPQIDKESEQ